MTAMVPVPLALLAKIPLFCEIKPLSRPQVNYHSRSLRQPLENQQELLNYVKTLEPLGIDVPCHIQLILVFARNDPKLKSARVDHPTKRHHGDIDNLGKAVNDALVKAKIIVDDQLIVSQSITKSFGEESICYVAIWSVAKLPTEVSPWHSHFAPISVSPSTTPSPTSEPD